MTASKTGEVYCVKERPLRKPLYSIFFFISHSHVLSSASNNDVPGFWWEIYTIEAFEHVNECPRLDVRLIRRNRHEVIENARSGCRVSVEHDSTRSNLKIRYSMVNKGEY